MREKHVLFAVRAGFETKQEKPAPCVGFNTTKAKTCLFSVFRSRKADNYGIGKQKNKTRFPFIVQKPASSAVGSDGSFLIAAYTRKNVLSHLELHRRHKSSPHRARITTKLGECMLHYAESPCCQVWESYEVVCLEVWLGKWEPDPFLHYLVFFFRAERPPVLYSQKADPELGQAPTSQARP